MDSKIVAESLRDSGPSSKIEPSVLLGSASRRDATTVNTARRAARVIFGLALVQLHIAAAQADVESDYLNTVKPILAKRCFVCHGAWKQNGGLRLDTATAIRRGGESGPAIVAGDSSKSLLIGAISGSAGFRMPPENEGTALSTDEIAIIRQWIERGAAAPANEQPDVDPRKHWSYQPVQRPSLPAITKNPDWARNPIDAFLAVKHDEQGLTAGPAATKATWLRRVYLDLIGLPPTPDALHEFIADERPDAVHRVVDGLLASPLYGQRWGRHWMDVWRYSDWYGSRAINEIRYSQRHIWRWRDWIVDSLNADLGYDQIVLQMLAGDELDPGNPDVVRATGFLGRNWYKFDRNVWMFETVEQSCQAFLGLTMKCARCHDHKFDPITQQDYYRWRAFFEPHDVRTDPISAKLETEKDATLGQVLKEGISFVYDKQSDAPTFLFQRGDSRRPKQDEPLLPGVPAVFGGADVRIHPVSLPATMVAPYLQEKVVVGLRKQANETLEAAERQFASMTAAVGSAQQELNDLAERKVLLAGKRIGVAQSEKKSLEARFEADRAKATQAVDCEALSQAASKAEREVNLAKAEYELLQAEQAAEAARNLQLADETAKKKMVSEAETKLTAARKTTEAARTSLSSTELKYTALGPIYPAQSSGRRLALARWIAAAENPRTARVAANHMWLRHFGEALVPTVANFGLNGRRPSHPELLDWLATELVDDGWSMKSIHRRIVTTAAYSLAATEGPLGSENFTRDRDNHWLWRMNSHRLESEVIRDSILFVAGELDVTLGGPELPESAGLESRRRSMYFRSTPNEKMAFLELFDQANPNECYRRQESVVPQQSLALFNSSVSLEMARRLGKSIIAEQGPSDAEIDFDRFVEVAYERILTRPPSPGEVEACRRFRDRHVALVQNSQRVTFPAANSQVTPPSSQPLQHTLENLVHVLLNHNDFVTRR